MATTKKYPDTLLSIAIALAVEAHGGTPNQDGTLYITHPLRMMMSTSNEMEQIVAILHDTIEDTNLTLGQIKNAGLAVDPKGYPPIVLDALDCLTKREAEEGTDEGYQRFLDRIAKNPLAIRVKLLDLHDNIDVTRLPKLGDWELKRTAKYWRAIQFLKRALNDYTEETYSWAA